MSVYLMTIAKPASNRTNERTKAMTDTSRTRESTSLPLQKHLINGPQVAVNQLMPLRYRWAWEHYLNGCANHWMPNEVPMTKDIETWRGQTLSEGERLII